MILKIVQVAHRKKGKRILRGKKRARTNRKQCNKMADLGPNISVITFNVSSLGIPIKI